MLLQQLEFIGTADAAKMLGTARFTVDHLIHLGKIPAFRVANRWVLSRSDVEEFAKTYVPKVGRPRKKRKYTRSST